jgi:hypothetical protein
VIDLLLLLLRPALKATEGGSRNPLHWLAAVVAFIFDVIIAHTTFRDFDVKPRPGEWTISQMLERLCMDFQHPEHMFFVALAKMINRRSPTRAHIKAVL